MTTQIKIEGMSCGHCVAGVQKALLAIPGVEAAEVTLEPGQATVNHTDSVSLADLRAAVDEEGYAVVG